MARPNVLQANIIGTCAAMELGMSLDEYANLPLPPLPEHGFASASGQQQPRHGAHIPAAGPEDDAVLMHTDLRH